MLTSPLQNKKRRYNDDRDGEQKEESDPLKDATTLYVGNLLVELWDYAPLADWFKRSFYTTEEQIHELFSKYVCTMNYVT